MGGRSAIGWFMLSEADRAVSARLLEQSEADGTLDELGFGVIHFAYSDRFFSGTSAAWSTAIHRLSGVDVP
jgi:hypothetical protein